METSEQSRAHWKKGQHFHKFLCFIQSNTAFIKYCVNENVMLVYFIASTLPIAQRP